MIGNMKHTTTAKIQIILFLCFGLNLSLNNAQDSIEIDYTVENQITQDDRVFEAKMTHQTVKQPFINIMHEAADKDQRFRFRSRTYPDMGEYVYEINGLGENAEERTFWVLLRRNGTHDCIHNSGVNLYIPFDGEHLAMAFETYDVYDNLPPCPGGKYHKH